jgi:hypothetical protein
MNTELEFVMHRQHAGILEELANRFTVLSPIFTTYTNNEAIYMATNALAS